MENTPHEATQQFMFTAIDPVIDRLIESPTEKKQGSFRWVTWGDKNTYPFYVKGLCKTVTSLRAIVMGCVDYVCGDDVILSHGLVGREPYTLDRRGGSARDLVKETASSIFQLGGFAWKITLNRDMQSVGEIECIPLENVRTDSSHSQFWYCEKWNKGYTSNAVKVFPAWQRDTKEAESIFYCQLWGEGTYPEPLYSAAIKACETERSIDDYHLGNIQRGFMGSYLVNFCDGKMPTPEEKREVEKNFTEKFAGHKNAGRIMFSWNRSREGMTTFQKMEVSDFGEKYETLSKHCRQQIFTSFRAIPLLFGLTAEANTGFSTDEFEQSFKLFNRTTIQPVQKTIVDALSKVLGEDVMTIVPFSLEGDKENNVR